MGGDKITTARDCRDVDEIEIDSKAMREVGRPVLDATNVLRFTEFLNQSSCSAVGVGWKGVGWKVVGKKKPTARDCREEG